MLLDSNIVIYCVLPEYADLRQWIFAQKISASDITRLEVLGYHQLTEPDRRDLMRLFELTTIYPVSTLIVDRAIALRQNRKMSLGDAVIAATALEYQRVIVTRNRKDFEWIEGLEVVDPLSAYHASARRS